VSACTCGTCCHFNPATNPDTSRALPSKLGECLWVPFAEHPVPMVYLDHFGRPVGTVGGALHALGIHRNRQTATPSTASAELCGCYEERQTVARKRTTQERANARKRARMSQLAIAIGKENQE